MDRRTLTVVIAMLGLGVVAAFGYVRDRELAASMQNLQQLCLQHEAGALAGTVAAHLTEMQVSAANGQAPLPHSAAETRSIAALEVRVRALESRLRPIGSGSEIEQTATNQASDAHAELSLAQLEQNPAVRAKIADIVKESRREQRRENERNFREMIDDEVYTFVQQREFDDEKAGHIVAAIDQLFGKQREIHEQIRARELSIGAGREKMRALQEEVEAQLKKELAAEDLDALYDVVPMLRGPGPGPGPGPGGPPF